MSPSVSESRLSFLPGGAGAWLARSDGLRFGILLGVGMTLARLPWLFTTLGEQDHGRLIMDAVVYATDGPETIWRYGILTSPLWTLPLAGVATLFGTAHLMIVTNVGGWLCGGLTTALAFVLLRKLGAERTWAAVGAVASELVPGTFYLSLYGYPSQYALPLLLASAVAFANALETRRLIWMVLACACYCGVALMKIDFALAGTLLFSVAIMQGKTFDRRTWLLLVFPLTAFAASVGVASMAIEGQSLLGLLSQSDDINPWSAEELGGSHVSTIFYACGFGTLGLFAATLIVGLAKRGLRTKALQIAIAWPVGALPLILFWLARPPMSTRHAIPGAMTTALIAALVGSYVLPRFRYAAVAWLVALVALNWPFGKPKYDFNYQPSGNLVGAISVNRRAFAVAHDIARRVTEKKETAKAIVGLPESDVLGGIDLMPVILVEMAARSTSAHGVPGPLRIRDDVIVEMTPLSTSTHAIDVQTSRLPVFTGTDGWITWVFGYVDPVHASSLVRVRGVGYYAIWRGDLSRLTRLGIKVISFDPDEMFETASGQYIWR